MKQIDLLVLKASMVWVVLLLATTLHPPASAAAEGYGPLHRDGVITGVVTDAAGNPLANIRVSVTESTRHDRPWGSLYAPATTTTADGSYTISNLPHDSYRVRFEDSTGRHATVYAGGSPALLGGDLIAVHDYRPRRVDIALTPAAHIRSILRAPGDAPLRFGIVTVYRYNGIDWEWYENYLFEGGPASATTFDLGGLAWGSYRVGFMLHADGIDLAETWLGGGSTLAQGQTVTVGTGEIAAGFVVELLTVQRPQGAISGRVTEAATGAPLAGIRVSPYTLNTQIGDWTRDWACSSDVTDDNGAYTIANLPPGNYKVGFADERLQYAPAYNHNRPTLGAAPHIAVDLDQAVTGIDAALDLGAAISGSVLAADGGRVTSITVRIYRYNDWDAWLHLDRFDYFNSDRFTIPGLQSGRYRLAFTASVDGNLVDAERWYLRGDTLETAETITVGTAEWVQLPQPLVLEERGAALDGHVFNEWGTPLAGVSVQVERRDAVHGFQYDKSAITDAQGYYRLRNLTPGEYRLRVDDPNHVYVWQYLGGALTPEASESLMLAHGERRTVDWRLSAGSRIEGQVSIGFGFPGDWIGITAVWWDGHDWIERHQVSAGGVGGGPVMPYSLGGLPPGRYRVRFQSYYYRESGGPRVALEWYDDAPTPDAATVLDLAARSVLTGIDAVLGNHLAPSGVLYGRVITAEGAGIPGIRAHLYMLTSYRDRFWYWREVGQVETAADGVYRFAFLAAGSYRVGFQDPLHRYAASYYTGTSTFEAAADISLVDGQTLQLWDTVLVPLSLPGNPHVLWN